jgi:hypothetical protein
MPAAAQRTIDAETMIMERVADFFSDPLGYVMWAFPWGEPGALEKFAGPDQWQAEVLDTVHKQLLDPDQKGAIQINVASGHGVGKTALIAWIILWAMSTRAHPQIICTANTKEQLLNKTWRELAKWQKLALNGHWFEWSATKFSKKSDKDTWFATAVTWSKERSEAFAGTHEKHVIMIFDEGSAIEDVIYEVAEGAMTTPGSMWFVFGNPTRNVGRFREIMPGGRFSKRWLHYKVDSRKALMTDKAKLQQWIDDYGLDSDFVRVRVLGELPRASSLQFIPVDIVEQAMDRGQLHQRIWNDLPRIIGVDVARFGDSESVIVKRQGLQVVDIQRFRELDLMTLASIVGREIKEWDAHACFIDVTGIGAGVVDRLKQMSYPITEINFGSRAEKENLYKNKRAEMWARMRDWLKEGGTMAHDDRLKSQLISVEYCFDGADRIMLERKEDLIDRGLESPDIADALALTFAENVYIDQEKGLPHATMQVKRGFDPQYMHNQRRGR